MKGINVVVGSVALGLGAIGLWICTSAPWILGGVRWSRLCPDGWLWCSGCVAMASAVVTGLFGDRQRAFHDESWIDRAAMLTCLTLAIGVGLIVAADLLGGMLTWVLAMLGLAVYVSCRGAVRLRLIRRATLGTDADALEKILADGLVREDAEVLCRLAQNPSMPITDLVCLYEFCRPHVSEWNPLMYSVLLSLAQHGQTPASLLTVLAECRQASIRHAVVGNARTPEESLRRLAGDGDDSVRTRAAMRVRLMDKDVVSFRRLVRLSAG